MKHNIISTVAILATVMLLSSIAGTTLLQQHVSALNLDWKQEFKDLTKQLERDVLDAAARKPPVGDEIQMLLDDYVDDVNRILAEPMFTNLIQNYERDVTTIFAPCEEKQIIAPCEEKQIKDFRATTHDFVKAVLGVPADIL